MNDDFKKMHVIAQALVQDLDMFDELCRIANLDNPEFRNRGYREKVRTEVLCQNYTRDDVCWSADDVERATCDLAWFMARRRADAFIEGVGIGLTL